jgi:peptidoglycan/xylan/chitin deacetylase (PgdA/CDA1 family)
MYHYISIPPEDADIYRLDLSVTPENLDAQLGYLKHAGFNVISLDELLLALQGESELPSRPIVLTFDDGYRDNYLYAFPLLKKYGFSATFSLITQPIDQNNPNYVTWKQVIEMHTAGMDFAAHSLNHADLKGKDVDFLVYQILGSKEAIEARVNEPLHFFNYPSGSYDQLTIDVIASANFWGALTTQEGSLNSYANRFEIRRVRIRGADTLEKFIEKVQP